VANGDSITLVVRRCFQCSAGKLIFDDTTDLTFYNAIGRTKVDPIPADTGRGIRSTFSVSGAVTRIRYTGPKRDG
jgi:hypothetical protein